jgi:hypothetical protein
MQIKGIEGKSIPVNDILTAGISVPIGGFPSSPGIVKCPIFITARCMLEMGACR